MSAHLRHAGAAPEAQTHALEEITHASPRLMQVLRAVRDLDLPDWWIVSGAIYNTAWNQLTGRPDMYGVKDIDLFYFDPDTSYEAEDRVIHRVAQAVPGDPPVETRNQARVHLWYERHFGHAYPALGNSAEGIDRFACKTHAVGLRLEADDRLTLYAPYGLDDIFAFRLVPNLALPNRKTHEAKAARQRALWPELDFVRWPEETAFQQESIS
ncbi:nucleotidyltransferase family protein [Tropicimonas sp. TH_r6]|uniref:nucleotidyltransferase family protein n=1 Tax=Tropicimonas sp. TH_r6 TaxID=3082085 RepID=UPI002954BA65|nr:nucleotidyltransferase family protein [Tropicimonas sp. TH_r6]MDV7144218.1 nucleotidyltransferase family protein [Tropicimonas sp. TH_r6]